MKKAYAPALFALSLMAATASAQMAPTVQNAARKAAYAAKLTPGAYTAPSGDQRGGVANDECDGAIDMTVGTECTPVAGSFAGATESQPASACSGFTSSAANDVWYSFTATGNVTVIEVTGGGDATTGVDVIVEVFSGACGSLEQIGCVDASLRAETESYTVLSAPGTTYYYRTYFWVYASGQTVDDFTTCVYTPSNIPANDLCTNADHQDLSMGGMITFNGDNTGALNTEGLGSAQVWVSFTISECSNIAVDYCGTSNFANGFTTLYSDCPPVTANAAASFNFDDCGDGNATILWELLPAGTYYYPVLTEEGSEGPYTINVSSSPCPQPPFNDECSDPMILVPGADCLQVGFTTAYATETLPAILCEGFTSPNALDVWFSFVATSTDHTIGVFGPNEADAMVELFSGTCGSLVSMACADATFPQNAGEATTELLVQSGLTVGETYFVRVYDWGHASPDHFFEICVTEGTNNNVGIAELNANDAWSIYPNPAEGIVSLSYSGANGTADVDVLDVTGRVVRAERTSLAQGSVRNISLSNLSGGTYTVRLTVNGVRSEKRLVVR